MYLAAGTAQTKTKIEPRSFCVRGVPSTANAHRQGKPSNIAMKNPRQTRVLRNSLLLVLMGLSDIVRQRDDLDLVAHPCKQPDYFRFFGNPPTKWSCDCRIEIVDDRSRLFLP